MLIKYNYIQCLLYLSYFQYAASEANVTLESLQYLIKKLELENKEITDKFNNLETNLNKEVKELEDKLNGVTDKIDLSCKDKAIIDAIDKISNKLAALENKIINNVTEAVKLNNVTDAVKLNNVTDAMKLNNVTDAVKLNNVTNAVKLNNVTDAVKLNNVTDSEKKNTTETEKFIPICTKTFKELSNVTFEMVDQKEGLMANIEANQTFDYDEYEDSYPVADFLDTFMVNKTGCTYKNLTGQEDLYSHTCKFNGILFEWQFAVRTGNNTAIWVNMGTNRAWSGYGFYLGEYDREVMQLRRKGSVRGNNWDEPEHAAPGVMAANRYVPFYFRIQPGTLTIGRECDTEPIFVYNGVTIERGDEVEIVFEPMYNTKYLYDCPAEYTDHSTV